MGLEALSGRDSAGGVAAPDGGLMRLSEKCARFLTVPNRIVLSKVLPCTPKAGEEATGVKMHKIWAWAGMICAVMAFYTGYKHK